jgi:hypothetical protein
MTLFANLLLYKKGSSLALNRKPDLQWHSRRTLIIHEETFTMALNLHEPWNVKKIEYLIFVMKTDMMPRGHKHTG